MRKCPGCNQLQHQLNFTAWVLYVLGSVVYNEDGVVESISPLVSKTTIAVGKELDGHEVRLKCPNCGYEGGVDDFPQIHVCWLTGQSADQCVEFDGIGRKWVNANAPFPMILDIATRLHFNNPVLTPEELAKRCAD